VAGTHVHANLAPPRRGLSMPTVIQLSNRVLALLAGLLALLQACSGGSGPSGPVEPPDTGAPPAMTALEASRFLHRASFGASKASIESLQALDYAGWLDAQVAAPVSLMKPRLIELGCPQVLPDGDLECGFIDPHIALRDRLWWEHAVYGSDQLRQRVGFALSEILVLSIFNAELAEYPVLIADYYDTLVQGAFGSYRDLLEEVTLHPAMGIYLSMLGNRKEDPVAGTRPDENYAREVMQLFSIGLVQLDAGGRTVLDGNGQPIPTYDQNDIEELARVLTGWTWATQEPKSADLEQFEGLEPTFGRMQPWPAFHDDGAKTIVGGLTIPAGQTPDQDLAMALDALFQHPNSGPFLSRQLIQRLVTSNPSADYVARVSEVFGDDGSGVRGNLEAVVRAILLDTEALAPPADPATFGKLREPLMRATALWRAFGTDTEGTPFENFIAGEFLGQQALYSPSVFNFFSPFYSTSTLAADGLVAPELQISTHATLSSAADLLATAVFDGTTLTESDAEWPLAVLDLGELQAVASDPEALLTAIEERLIGQRFAPAARDALLAYIAELDLESEDFPEGFERVQDTLTVVLVSPDFIVQK
jgi:uncharacterized protein (DUF1800 family)